MLRREVPVQQMRVNVGLPAKQRHAASRACQHLGRSRRGLVAHSLMLEIFFCFFGKWLLKYCLQHRILMMNEWLWICISRLNRPLLFSQHVKVTERHLVRKKRFSTVDASVWCCVFLQCSCLTCSLNNDFLTASPNPCGYIYWKESWKI